MAYISKHHPVTGGSSQDLVFFGYGGYNMPHVNNVNFPKSVCSFVCAHHRKQFWEARTVFRFLIFAPLLILMGKTELVALLCLSSWCFVIVV